MMSTGVSYDRPDLRPTCSITDVCVAAVPAVRITRGFVTDRFIRRTASTTGPTCHRIAGHQEPQQHHAGTDQRADDHRDHSLAHRTKLTGDARQQALSMLIA